MKVIRTISTILAVVLSWKQCAEACPMIYDPVCAFNTETNCLEEFTNTCGMGIPTPKSEYLVSFIGKWNTINFSL